ncbi:zinc ribbon domain-containing protein [Nitrosopumilus sp.]|uniref:Zn-ribbon domain-containing OB-fold protein n=1 Tax=Nitrosopumilus sp. TaxID=2024843 RepID=UPI00247E591E|nr:zinc ribbon domain-containing protein [Nitrosopumilus sp.]MCV0409945.1 zinc ribbon domain-containing protein [Nitrosopumilus sp.]
MNFESELHNGNFYIPECTKCLKVVWPPSEFCNHCFGEISLKKKAHKGKIIEFSRQDDMYFCLVEFDEEIKVMAKIPDTPEIGQTVKISKCGISNGNYFFQVI